jgi:heme/copper-type cytochrome/quinol oxidase subunit 3
VHDFRDQLHTFDITRDAYSSIYYVLLGADHGHVFIGIVFNLWLLWKLARGFTTYRVNAVQAVAWYWYAVTAITVVVLLTVLSPRM